MTSDQIDINIKANAKYQELEAAAKALDNLAKKTREAGLDCSAFEKQAHQANQELAKKYAADYAMGLESLIAKEKSLGNNTDALSAQLKALNEVQAKGPLGNVGKANLALTDVLKEVPGLNAVSHMFNGGTQSAIAWGAVVLEAAHKMHEAVREFAAAQEAVAGLDTALAQSGQLTESYRTRLQDLAGELAEATAIADDQWLAVLTKLTQYGSTPESIGMDVEAVKNLAGLLGGDLASAAQIWGKALQGNFAMLQRYGIRVEETASQSEKLKTVMEELAKRGGGQLEARAETLTGAMRRMGDASAELAKNFVNNTGLGRALTEQAQRTAEAMGWLANATGSPIDRLHGLKNSVQATTEHLNEMQATEAQVKSATDAIVQAYEDRAQAIELEKDALLAKARAQDEIENDQKAFEKAQVDDDLRQGKITQVQASQRKGEIDKKFAESKYARDSGVIREQLELSEKNLSGKEADLSDIHHQINVTKQDLHAATAIQSAKNKVGTAQQNETIAYESVSPNREKYSDAIQQLLGWRPSNDKQWRQGLEALRASAQAKKDQHPGSPDYGIENELTGINSALLAEKALASAKTESSAARSNLRALTSSAPSGQASVSELETKLETLKASYETARKLLAKETNGLLHNIDKLRSELDTLQKRHDLQTKTLGLTSAGEIASAATRDNHTNTARAEELLKGALAHGSLKTTNTDSDAKQLLPLVEAVVNMAVNGTPADKATAAEVRRLWAAVRKAQSLTGPARPNSNPIE